MREENADLTQLIEALAQEIISGAKDGKVLRMLGFTGVPGSGKSTATQLLAQRLADEKLGIYPLLAGLVPMDGFHKANEILAQEGSLERKGAPDTFDVVGYLMTLDRIHAGKVPVYTPRYDRAAHHGIAGAYRVEPQGLAITEGNYLALQDGPFLMLREQIDLLIYLDVPAEITYERLVERRLERGDSMEQAQAWVKEVDQVNALNVQGSMGRCDRIWHLTDTKHKLV